jgi:hypothetical protein
LPACVALVPAAIVYGQTLSPWIIPSLMVFFLAFGALRRVPVYESMVEGGKEGFQVALRIIPYMVVILVAVAMLRASGALDLLVGALGRFTGPWGCRPKPCPWPCCALSPVPGPTAYWPP